MKYRLITKLFGLLTILIGLTMIPSVVWSLYYNEPDYLAFIYSILICWIIGGLMFGLNYHIKDKLFLREAFFIVGFGWFIAGLFGSLPYIMTGALPSFADAFFETISGFTTTGATVLTEIEVHGKGLLFWRSLTHWLGGMGIIVLFVALFPFLGVGGRNLINFESPGPIRSSIKSRTIDIARYLWYIYVSLSAAQVLLLMIFGMNLFNSLCHTFGTMATGGFSTLNDNIAGFDSVNIEIIITLFMFLAGVNFSLS